MVTSLLFAAVVLTVAGWVAIDAVASRMNTDRLLEIGAKVQGRWQTHSYFVLVVLWVIGTISEVVVLDRSVKLLPFLIGLSFIMTGRHLRRRARNALGQRWTLDVVSLHGNPLVTGRIYDRMRHPEYGGTLLLFLGVSLLHGAWFSLCSTVLVGVPLLYLRVRLEESVLDKNARYLSLLGDRPRFLPRRPRHKEQKPSTPTQLRPRTRSGDQPSQP